LKISCQKNKKKKSKVFQIDRFSIFSSQIIFLLKKKTFLGEIFNIFTNNLVSVEAAEVHYGIYLLIVHSLSLSLSAISDRQFYFIFLIFLFGTHYSAYLFTYLNIYLFIYLFIYLLLIYFHSCAFSLGVSEHQKLRKKLTFSFT